MHGLNLVHSHSTMMGRLNAIDIALLDGDRIKTYITKKKKSKKNQQQQNHTIINMRTNKKFIWHTYLCESSSPYPLPREREREKRRKKEEKKEEDKIERNHINSKTQIYVHWNQVKTEQNQGISEISFRHPHNARKYSRYLLSWWDTRGAWQSSKVSNMH